jgi:hypothetical protein
MFVRIEFPHARRSGEVGARMRLVRLCFFFLGGGEPESYFDVVSMSIRCKVWTLDMEKYKERSKGVDLIANPSPY